jgi:hypothetical protein
VTTNASNVGIDKHSIALQVQFEWPCYLLTYYQERGRGSRSGGVRSTCIVFGDFASFIYLMSQLLIASKLDDGQSSCGDEVEGFNSAMSPWKHSTIQQNKKKTYTLGLTGRHNLRERTKPELHEVLHFVCLDLGCRHACGESYLATGCLDFNIIDEKCDNSCSICSRKWHNQFLPVYSSSVVAFLEYLMHMGKLPQEVDYKAPISLLLAKSKFWKEAIFDCAAGGISQMQVDASFLSLIASRIIQMEPENTSLEWVITRQFTT